MPAKPVHELDQVLSAIRGSRGVKSAIAERLGVTRNTVDNYLVRWATARDLYNEERALLVDMSESVVVRALVDEDVRIAAPMARFVLQQRGAINGWQPTVKFDGKMTHDGTVQSSGIVSQLGLSDLANLDDEELNDAIEKLKRVNNLLAELQLPDLDGDVSGTDSPS